MMGEKSRLVEPWEDGKDQEYRDRKKRKSVEFKNSPQSKSSTAQDSPEPARSEFGVAIFCALTLEADAVDALLDGHWNQRKGHPDEKAPNDPNSYTTGIIGLHNVVLVHMPQMGKVSAAFVAAFCLSSFPNIKLALVVGICGAIPSTSQDTAGRNIYLGDVIVSDGVVEYDFGTELPEGFTRKATSYGSTTTEIRSLLAKLKGRRGRKELAEGMEDSLQTLHNTPDLVEKYMDAVNDEVYDSTYRHIEDRIPCERCGCDERFIRRHRIRTAETAPAVHFGLMASGDTVMRSAEMRDRIASRDKVIGFEMEGSGVGNTIPCVIIKGACDYADSHKNKIWQPYAAATAAACAKAFLQHWRVTSSF
ncbi:unnamed protein product [Parascedosporium putredinis]|uniref:Nucleoside phosphorylase domain-containing protein n=1 Tax=Parascedosporium putredinis TaxID=1442378 RepID=A0A9P1M9W6_9PEZI|nr:unnamed protein product [Parascedosporium putredinis]CAI7991629.1 unnamed protein product [Parascedosporium putredinis]